MLYAEITKNMTMQEKIHFYNDGGGNILKVSCPVL